MQGDITSTYYLGHGDSHHILLLPGSVEECYSMAMDAFDLAERFQTPVFLMTDLDLGMNNWMADPLPYPDRPLDRGKVLRTKAELDAHIAKFKEFARYRDVDGDGIPLPHAAGLHGRAGRDLLHPRLGPQRARAVHGAARRLQEQHGPAGAQVRDGARSTFPSPSSPTAPARGSASSPTAPPTSPSRRRA